MELFTIFVIFCLGWIIGNRVLLYRLRAAIQEEAKSLGIDLNDDSEDTPTLFTEVENNTILVFNRKTNTFVCQGATLEEAAGKSNLKYAKVEHNNELFCFVNGKVKAYTE